MKGFITDNELAQADQEFPGIARLFGTLRVKPRTFLDLVALYDGWCMRQRLVGRGIAR
jgi:hypothetical protein